MSIFCIFRPHRRGDSGCPCSACCTGKICPGGMGGHLRWIVYHSLNDSSDVTYRGNFGGGASAYAFVTSAPMTMYFSSADRSQKVRAPDCSRSVAYVGTRVTNPNWL